MAEPLSKVDRITVVSTGDSAGANKITGDMAKMAAQVPALFEALSGMDIRELMSNIAGIRHRGDGNGHAGTAVVPLVDGK
jgi:flotillin